jgi:hypothetical protein
MVPTRVVAVEACPGDGGCVLVGGSMLGKQELNPRYQKTVLYMRVASRPKPKKMKIMKPDATGVQRSKKTVPSMGYLTMVFHSSPLWILCQE